MDIHYTELKEGNLEYTERMNKEYDYMSKYYDLFLVLFPLWKKWICSVIKHIKGDKILEVSFGNGYLMKKYAKKFTVYGIDYNANMVELTKRKCEGLVDKENIIQGNVESLPYPDETFDTVINTMAFTGYPNGDLALDEMIRVLRKDGLLLIVDFDYPKNRNKIGCGIVKYMESKGDIIKNIEELLSKRKLKYTINEIGAFGSVKKYIIQK